MADFVTVAELRATLGIGSLYADPVLEEICTASTDIIKAKLWYNKFNIIAHSNVGTVGTVYLDRAHDFYIGKTVVINGCGSSFNGSKTVIAIKPTSFDITTNHASDTPKHNNVPYGTVFGTTYLDYANVPAVREAAMMTAVDIFQARSVSQTGGISPDYTPSPYRMGNSLLSRVRGLLADYLDPGGLVG